MKYANKYVMIKDAEHLDLVVATTGMKMTDWDLCSVSRRLDDGLAVVFDDGLAVVFDEDFDRDNDDWGFDYLPLLDCTLELEQIWIGGE